MSCTHENAVIVPPCCTTPEPDTGMIACGCGGMSTVECPDCDEEIDEDTIQAILEGRN